jgi:hypothetical protein
LGSRKRKPTGDNTIRCMWTDEMSCLHETQMKKSEKQRIMGGIDGGSMSMESLAYNFITSCTIGSKYP